MTQLTNKAQNAYSVLQELKDIMNDKIESGTEGITDKQELSDYMYECKHNISCINIAQNRLYDYFAQEEIDDFYVEQHNNSERFFYTVNTVIENIHSDALEKFYDFWNDGNFGDDFDYMEAEKAGQEARHDGKSFKTAYTNSVLGYMIDVSKTRLSYYTANNRCYDADMFNASVITFCTKLLQELN